MLEILAWTLGLIVFLVVLAISIGLHEGGHMVVAKAFKLSVPRFFIGFGPTVWSKRVKDTEYGVKALPLGGFVLIEDETQEVDSLERNLLSHVSPWKRTLVFLAGPAVNIVLGIAILAVVLMTVPLQIPTTQVETANDCSVAAETDVPCGAFEAGIMAGDTVTKIDGNPLFGNQDFAPLLDGKEVAEVTVDRNGTEKTFTVNLTEGKMGINLEVEDVYRDLGQAFGTIGDVFVLNVESLIRLPSHLPGVVQTIFGAERDPEAPGSLIVAGKTYGDVSANTEMPTLDKVQTLALYSGLLNLGLGLINLLPILPLDGGRISIAFMDSIKMGWAKLARRKYNPVSIATVKVMSVIAVTVVFSYMALLMLSDIVSISRGVL